MESLKVFNDPIHGSIQMPLYCQWIIDTPEFQRLRYIKQLGSTCYVYPCAVHTRFDHSIGVCHLAGRLVNVLKQDPRNKIEASEVACVEIAALCHDLGHGPFSHSFEDIVRPEKKWKHENQSAILVKYLIEKNDNKLKKKLADHNIEDREIEFICELITGRSSSAEGKLHRESRYFLHQIVNNSVNGVDVDKWDYFSRDTHFLGVQSAFNFDRIIPFVKVFDIPYRERTRKELCFRDKVASDLNQMFLTRRRLHHCAYQHRVTKVINIMLRDAMIAAADHLKYYVGDENGEKPKEYSLLDAVDDPRAFCQLNDGIIYEIERSQCKEKDMTDAQEIISRIHNRQLYQCILEIQNAEDTIKPFDSEEIKNMVIDGEDGQLDPDEGIWKRENIVVEVSHFDFGKEQKNPLLTIPFYKKSEVNANELKDPYLKPDKLPADSPERLECSTVRIYTKVPAAKREVGEKDREKCKRAVDAGFYKGQVPPGTPQEQERVRAESSSDNTAAYLPVGTVSPYSQSDGEHAASTGTARGDVTDADDEHRHVEPEAKVVRQLFPNQ